MSARATKVEYTIFTAEGVSFTESGRTLAHALKRAAIPAHHNVVAPSAGSLTALVVQHRKKEQSRR
jgi:hypothetical protein